MKKSNIYYGIVAIPIILILFTSSILFYFNEKTVNEISSEYFQYIEEDFINDNKQILVEKIKNITQKIDYESQKVEENLRDDLKEKMIMAINIAKNTYEKNKNSLEHDQLRQLVVDNISNLTFYEGRGYFYILDVNDFTILGHPTKKFIGKDFSKFKDATGQKPIHIQKKLLLENNATIVYLKLYFYRPNEDKQMYPKLVSSTIFKPLNLFFGTGEYLDIVENKTKQKIISEIKNLNKLNLGNNVNLVKVDDLNLNNYESIILNESNLNPLNILKSKKLKEQLISKLKKDSKAFITYKDENNVIKYAYFYYDAKWNWLLSSEFSLEDLKKSFDDLNNITQIKLDKLKDSDTISTLFIVFILLIISLYIFSKYKTLISNYTRTIENKNTLLAKHKIELEDKVKKAIEENREKELKLFEQSKMADMARMMSNIAHQWRQPLSVISTAAGSIKLKQMLQKLDEKSLESSIQSINNSVSHLSNTIDIFTSVVNTESNYKEVLLQDSITNTLNIYTNTCENKNIRLINNINLTSPIKITLDEGALSQVIINIINNAIDIIIEREIKKPEIISNLVFEEKTIIISIEDNAGGINKDVISKIFEPYFTTKHESQGTGLSLHLCYKIVTDTLKGSLYVRNTNNGAKFSIEIPYEKK